MVLKKKEVKKEAEPIEETTNVIYDPNTVLAKED